MRHSRPKLLVFLFVYILTLFFLSFSPPAEPVESGQPGKPCISATAAVLMDGRTGQILYNKNAYKRKPPASTTKIMTALLAIEGGDLSEIVTVSPNAASVGESSMELWEGEKLSLEDLLYGALLESGNDACVAIAEHIAGTEQNFVLLMNQKAKMLGAYSTTFKNTNGLPAPGHMTTARDLAVIARYALSKPVFQKMVSTKTKRIENGEGRLLQNTNGLLWSAGWVNGVKTGTTDEAGACLVASGKKGNRQLISVVLHSDDRWSDSLALLNYGFECFFEVNAVREGEQMATLAVSDGIEKEVKAVTAVGLDVVLPVDGDKTIEKKIETETGLAAPVRKGQQVGKVIYLSKESVLGSVDLISDRDVEKLPARRNFIKK